MFCRRLVCILVVLLVVVLPAAKCFILANSSNKANETRTLENANSHLYEESRKKKDKDKYYMGLILGAILIKMILFPLAVKAMAVMSSVSVLLSTMSLIISSIVGYAKLVVHKQPEPLIKLVHVNDVWAKGDEVPKDYITPDNIEYTPSMPLDHIHYNIK